MRNRTKKGFLILLVSAIGFCIVIWKAPGFFAVDDTVAADTSTKIEKKSQVNDDSIGAKLFKANCASCHYPDKDLTGPALKGARERWIKNSSEENFYAWIKDSKSVIDSGDPYAIELYRDWKEVDMNAQQLTNAQIDQIFEYVESY